MVKIKKKARAESPHCPSQNKIHLHQSNLSKQMYYSAIYSILTALKYTEKLKKQTNKKNALHSQADCGQFFS